MTKSSGGSRGGPVTLCPRNVRPPLWPPLNEDFFPPVVSPGWITIAPPPRQLSVRAVLRSRPPVGRRSGVDYDCAPPPVVGPGVSRSRAPPPPLLVVGPGVSRSRAPPPVGRRSGVDYDRTPIGPLDWQCPGAPVVTDGYCFFLLATLKERS